MTQLMLDAEALYGELRKSASTWLTPHTQLVGITSGGAWLAQRLHSELALPGKVGVISSAMHRDDFGQRGLSNGGQTALPFDVTGAHIVLLDDVLYTGRTLRAVINELFDYGRPASIRLVVLVERSGRELPLQADWCAARIALAPTQSLRLAQGEDGRFSFDVRTI